MHEAPPSSTTVWPVSHEASSEARKQASAATRSPFVFFLFTGALFLVYTSISLFVLKKVNARYSLGTKRGTL